ncbi:MAG: TolC family protein [Desulfuromonadaceae bacterium]|nr:TolC family protein [Desulfuromonadaceae bacterium]
MIRWIRVVILVVVTCCPALADDALTLEHCLELARARSPLLSTAASAPRLAQTAENEARSVFRPQLELDAGYTRQQAAQQVNMGSVTAPTQERDYPHASIGLNQLLYDFGRSAGRVEAAGANRRAAQFGYAAQEQDILLRTAAAFYRVLTTQTILQAAQDEVAQTGEHRRVAQTLYDQGVVTRNDLLQAEVKLAASRQQVLARQGEEDNAWLELNYLTARPPDARGTLCSAPLSAIETIETIPATIDQRPDLLGQSQRMQGAEAGIRQARGAFWPQLFARLGADYVDNRYVEEQTIYSATLGLRCTLYDGSARDARLQQAREALEQERQRLAELRQRAQLEERTARNDARVAAKQISVAQTAIAMAEENLRINQDRYREQVGTATEVLDAETLLTAARTDLARARFAYQLALVRMRHAIGEL